AAQHAIEHALDVADRPFERHPGANEEVDGQVVEALVAFPGLEGHLLEWHAHILDWLADAEAAALRLRGKAQLPPVVAHQAGDAHVGRHRIGGGQDAATPARQIGNGAIAFAADERIHHAKPRPRDGHEIDEALDHVLVAVVVLAPVTVDRAYPVLDRAADRLDVVVLGFRYVDDQVGIEQRGRQGNVLHHPPIRYRHDAVRYLVAAHVDQLGALALGDGRHAGDAHE